MSGLALGHHIGEASLTAANAPKKVRLFWSGIGVGWAAFWLLMVFLGRTRKQWHETVYHKPDVL